MTNRSASSSTPCAPPKGSARPQRKSEQLSCLNCRRRKTRCDKCLPCSTCKKLNTTCIIPAERAPRRSHSGTTKSTNKRFKNSEAELSKRLDELENILKPFCRQDDSLHIASDAAPPKVLTISPEEQPNQPTISPALSPLPSPGRIPVETTTLPLNKSSILGLQTNLDDLDIDNYAACHSGELLQKNTDHEIARSDGASVSAAAKSNALDESCGPDLSFNVQDSLNHGAFVLGYRASDLGLHSFHPLPSELLFIWELYVENIDPVVKILHVPSTTLLIRKTAADMAAMSPEVEALMFSIYYAVITSLDEDEVEAYFSIEKAHLIKRYRCGVEMSLVKANFLVTVDLIVIQALTIFTTMVRWYDNTQFSWTLTGILVRVSQAAGLHRDGTLLNNRPPFETEMRRRVWWAICSLDVRSAEDQNTEFQIAENSFDTHFPSNVNDMDISTDMSSLPPEKSGITDMTFSLIRYEICHLTRRLQINTNLLGAQPDRSRLQASDSVRLLQDTYQHLNNKYLRNCTDQNGVLCWVATVILRFFEAKVNLVIYQLEVLVGNTENTNQDKADLVFMSCTEIVECDRVLTNEPSCKQYRWLFRTYTEWQAVAYLLLEIPRRPWSELAERAWKALNALFNDTASTQFFKSTRSGAFFTSLKRLIMQAQRHRETELAQVQSNVEQTQQSSLSAGIERSTKSSLHDGEDLRQRLERAPNQFGQNLPELRTPKNKVHPPSSGMRQTQPLDKDYGATLNDISTEYSGYHPIGLGDPDDQIDQRLNKATEGHGQQWTTSLIASSAFVGNTGSGVYSVPDIVFATRSREQSFLTNVAVPGMEQLDTTSSVDVLYSLADDLGPACPINQETTLIADIMSWPSWEDGFGEDMPDTVPELNTGTALGYVT